MKLTFLLMTLVLCSCCAKSGSSSPEVLAKSEFEMECSDDITLNANITTYRCENNETVCYITKYESAISCFQKRESR